MVLRCDGRDVTVSGRAAFRWLWAGQTASVFGTAVSALAVPTIAIVTLGASPFAVGALQAIQFAAFPLLGLVAGVWVDRWSRRRTMLVADVVRALALGSIPVAAFAHVLGYAQLLVVAACVGVASVFFDVAYQSLLPSVVDPDDLESANARLQATDSGAQIAGAGLAGALIAAVGAPVAVIVDAASYVVSIASLLVLRVRETHQRGAGEPPAAFFASLREGVGVVFGSPVLLRIAGATATSNFGFGMTISVYLLFLYRTLHLSPAVAGTLMALSNIGFAGALLAPKIARRFGPGRTMIGAMSVGMASQVLVPLALVAPPLPLLFLAELAITACVPIYNVTQVSLRQRMIPAAQLGRANATLKTIVWGTLPVSMLLGGALANRVGIVPTLVAGVIVACSAVLWLLGAPILALRAAAVAETPGG